MGSNVFQYLIDEFQMKQSCWLIHIKNIKLNKESLYSILKLILVMN